MWLLTVPSAFVASILGQYLLRRTRLVRSPLLAFLLSGTLVGIWLIAVFHYMDTPTIAIAGTLLYAFLCELYIFLFSFAYSSISANLLVRLQDHPLERDAIDRLYDSNAMVARRVRDLIEVDFLTSENGSIVATPKGKMVAAVFVAVRRFFGHR